jgi:hypothetical protein
MNRTGWQRQKFRGKGAGEPTDGKTSRNHQNEW